MVKRNWDHLSDKIGYVLDMVEELHARELVKVSILEGAELSAKEYLQIASEKLNATQVCSIGRRFACDL